MALGSDVNSPTPLDQLGDIVRPAQVSSNWVDLHTLPETADNASPLTAPDTHITGSENSILQVNGTGTLLRLRLKYDDGNSSVTSPIVTVFGRTTGTRSKDSNDFWERLPNKAGTQQDVTLTMDLTNDITDGTYKYTALDADDHSWDLAGCDEVLVGVTTAYNATGTESNAVIEAKVI